MKLGTGYEGVSTEIILQDGNLVAGTWQDCTPIAEDAKARHNAGMFGTSEMKHAARLPIEKIEEYCNTHGITLMEWMNNPVHIKRMLSDPDLADFRIWKGNV